ncbi:MAG: cation:proton antiporter [Phycisphaerales bacterium]
MTDLAAQSIALSLGLSALVTVGCRRVKIPPLLPLLGVGLVMGTSWLGLIDASSLGPALKGLITIAIGLLIFEGALHLTGEEFARAPRAVWGLLTAGAVITWIGAAAAANLLLGMSLPISILLGATLIVTGPTVVQPILRMVRVSPRLRAVLSAEAVLIDPLGVVATIATLEVLRLYFARGSQSGLAGEGAWIFVKPLVGGAGVGLVFGIVGYYLLKRMGKLGRPEPQLLTLAAIGLCMTCVGAGESITPEAGLAAVTICGVIMARARVLGATELRSFKELLAVILVGTLFVLLASRFEIGRVRTLTWRDGVFVLALLFAVRPAAVMLSTWRSKLTFRERLFISTFAPRGIVALSVATVAAADLRTLLSGSAIGPPVQHAGVYLIDAQRLELIMFVVIVGTVLLASTLSPLLVWVLRVKAGEGNSVLMIGVNPLSIELARWLSERKIDSRVIDSNHSRVAAARAAGVDSIAGDATDLRWLDDVGAPHGLGTVISWTGNHDVDQVATRWADERLGPGHAALWSSKPARGTLSPADISGGDAIGEWLDRLNDQAVELAGADDPGGLERVLGWIVQGRFLVALPGLRPPTSDVSPVFVGLKSRPDSNAGAAGTLHWAGVSDKVS